LVQVWPLWPRGDRRGDFSPLCPLVESAVTHTSGRRAVPSHTATVHELTYQKRSKATRLKSSLEMQHLCFNLNSLSLFLSSNFLHTWPVCITKEPRKCSVECNVFLMSGSRKRCKQWARSETGTHACTGRCIAEGCKQQYWGPRNQPFSDRHMTT